MKRRCGPSPTIVARNGTAGSRIARAPRSTPSVATGRLRETRRIADTTCTGRPAVPRHPAVAAPDLGAGAPPRAVDAVGHHLDGRVPGRRATRAAAIARHRAERDAAPRPAPEVAHRTEHRRRPVDDAVEGRRDRQAGVERDGHELRGERADHAEVRVRDVEAARVEPAAHLTPGERVDGDAAGQRDREPVHRDAVVTTGRRTVPLAVRTGRRREHLHLVTGGHEVAGQVAHLALDPPDPRRIAVGDHRDLHGPTACHARGWAAMSRTIVAFHAHPDDEALLTAGTMACLAAQGHRVVLVLATDGGAGLAAAELRRDGALGTRRLHEARRSADVLGVARVEWLGYADSGSSAEPEPDTPGVTAVLPGPPRGGRRAARRGPAHRARRPAPLLRRERRLRPPRPRARPRGRGPGGRIAGTPRVLEATVPRDTIVRAVRAVGRVYRFPAEFDPTSFERAFSARSDITHRIDVRRHVRAKRESMRAHASQATGGGAASVGAGAQTGDRTLGAFLRIPRPLYDLVFGREWFRDPALPAGGAVRTDIFEGDA